MSRLGCNCGHTIVDQTDNISYKAKFIRDKDREAFWDHSNDIAAFIEALQTGQRDEWIRSYFTPTYPTTLHNSSVISDIISRHELPLESTMYQCESCSRILIQLGHTNTFASFQPEDKMFPNILDNTQKKP